MHPIRLPALLAALAVATAALAGRPAAAQSIGGSTASNGGFQPPVHGQAPTAPAPAPPPPGLPGASQHGAVAPATKSASDLQPNDALFDAINRGDMAAARDALARGADLAAQNVLGMTPLELSVDLARNDITFLLLSMRGSGLAGAPAPVQVAKAGQPKSAASASLLRAATARRGETRLASAVHAPAPRPADAGLAPASVRYAGSTPGIAVPQAGFLGF